MARTSTTGVSYFANPRGGLSIRGPLDNNRLNGRISNPPRFGKFGGLFFFWFWLVFKKKLGFVLLKKTPENASFAADIHKASGKGGQAVWAHYSSWQA